VMEEAVEAPPPPIEPTSAEAGALLQEGIPLLQQGEVPVLPELMADIWCEVCELTAQHLENQAEELHKVKLWPEEKPQLWLARMAQYFRDGEVESESQQEKDFLTFLLVHTWRPFLRPWATQLAPLTEDARWQRGHCPVCGGQPDFAYLGEEGGERFLVCGRCDTEWRYPRLGCPFCGNQDTSSYGYYPDDEGVYRLYACNKCRRYVKTIDLRQAEGKRLLPVERVATVGMDFAALQAEYRSA